MARIILILLLFSFPKIWCYSQGFTDNSRLKQLINNKGQAEVVISYHGVAEIDRLTRLFSIISVKDKDVHLMLSPLTVEKFISEGYEYRIIERDESKGLTSSKTVREAMEWDSYPSYPQYDSIMRFFASTYPEICVLDTIGTSVDGRLVMVLKISDNCRADEPEPETFYSSTIHGNETGGFVLMLRLADYLLSNYPDNGRVRNLVDKLQIWINPLANPDGTYNNGDYIESPVRNNANGYDLNRNYPDPDGPFTVRQKETLDMMEFMSGHRFVISANFHSGVEVVNYPWDRWQRRHADDEWFYQISRAWADTVHIYSRKGYMDYLDNGVTNGYDWYLVYGGRQDYVTYSLYGREVTVELDTNYITPAEDLSDLWEFNKRSLLGYLENALYGIHGKVLDILTDEPVSAKVFIEGYDKDNSHTYSDSLTGDFIRLLSPGSYNITFSADGYLSKKVPYISVLQDTETSIEVRLTPYTIRIDSISPGRILFFPNPATISTWAVLPEEMEGTVDVTIYSVTGIKISDYRIEIIEEQPHLIDISRLPNGTYFVVFTSRGKKLSFRGTLIIAD